MKRFGILNTALMLAVVALVFVPAAAQTASGSSAASYKATPLPADTSGASYKTRPVPSVEVLTPSSFATSPSATANLIDYLPEAQMTQAARDLAASAGPAIRDGATLAGIEFANGSWSYQQLVCQALPGHMFLLFQSNRGAGDVSLFSAAIPLAGKGRVRVIPIRRRGFSLFSPAPVNALAIAQFNRIRFEEPAHQSPDWLATALCYAALTGARPEISPPSQDSADPSRSLSFPPTLEVGGDGDSTVRFVDVAAEPQPMEWALTFNSGGQLLKVMNIATSVYAVKLIPSEVPPRSSAQGPR